MNIQSIAKNNLSATRSLARFARKSGIIKRIIHDPMATLVGFGGMVLIALSFSCGTPSSAWQNYKLAQEAEEQELYAQAVAEYEKSFEKNCEGSDNQKICPEIQYKIGKIYQFELNNYDAALFAYEKFIDYYPKHLSVGMAHFHRGEIYEKLQKQLEALDSFEKGLDFYQENFPEDEQICINIYAEIKNIAIEAWAIENKNCANVRYAIAKLYDLKLNRPEKSLNAYQKFVDSFPDDPRAGEVYLHLGEIYQKNEKYTEAAEAYNKALSFYENLANSGQEVAWAYLRIGQACEELGNYQEAIDAYKKIPDYCEESINAQYKIAQIYDYDLHKYENAIEEYQKAINKSGYPSAAANTYFRIAEIYELELKELQKASEGYKTVVEKYGQFEGNLIDSDLIEISRERYNNLCQQGYC